MKQRYSHRVFSLLLVLLVGLGAAFAGTPLCSPDCPVCKPVPVCCSEMDGNVASAPVGTTGHLPEDGDCAHGDDCVDGLLPGDSSPVLLLTANYDLSALHSTSSAGLLQNQVTKNIIPVPHNLTPDQSPPLFLLHCSFLI